MNKLKKKYLHWLWKHRYNKAWKRSCKRASSYHEEISHCSPWFYLEEELKELKT